MTTQASWIPADTFGSRLNRVRKAKGLTVEQISAQVGVAQPTWSTWERGATPRNMGAAVAKIALALGVDRDWLMWGERGETDGGLPGSSEAMFSDSGHFRSAA